MYLQRVQYPSEKDWKHRIIHSRVVANVDEEPRDARLRIHLQHANPFDKSQALPKDERIDVDALLVASGYIRDAHESMLRHAEYLGPRDNGSKRGWKIKRDYRVELDEEKVSNQAGIWLQGCNESTHGLSDTLLSILATRGGEMVESIFGDRLSTPSHAS